MQARSLRSPMRARASSREASLRPRVENAKTRGLATRRRSARAPLYLRSVLWLYHKADD
jgi:hypothetical protein